MGPSICILQYYLQYEMPKPLSFVRADTGILQPGLANSARGQADRNRFGPPRSLVATLFVRFCTIFADLHVANPWPTKPFWRECQNVMR
jgi:hypothetical protein